MTTEEQPTITATPSWTFQLNETETITVFQALRVYLQALSQQPDPPTDTLGVVVHLLQVVKPAAVQAAQVIQGQQNGLP